MNTCGDTALEVASTKIVPNFVCIAANLVCDALHASAGQFVLDAAQFIKGCNHSNISISFVISVKTIFQHHKVTTLLWNKKILSPLFFPPSVLARQG
jgi:hypothetical protein